MLDEIEHYFREMARTEQSARKYVSEAGGFQNQECVGIRGRDPPFLCLLIELRLNRSCTYNGGNACHSTRDVQRVMLFGSSVKKGKN